MMPGSTSTVSTAAVDAVVPAVLELDETDSQLPPVCVPVNATNATGEPVLLVIFNVCVATELAPVGALKASEPGSLDTLPLPVPVLPLPPMFRFTLTVNVELPAVTVIVAGLSPATSPVSIYGFTETV